MARPDLLTLARLEPRGDTLEIDYSLDGRAFHKRYRWAELDLAELEHTHGRQLLERIYFHLAAFEAIPFAGLRPRRLDFGRWRRFATSELETLWRRVLHGVGAQWRWENNLPAENGPQWVGERAAGGGGAVSIESSEVPSLCFNGGGKDSLVAMRLLERSGLAYSTLAYSHSTYGGDQRQHELIAAVESHCRPARSHRQWVEDELWDQADSLAGEYGGRRPIVCETPISIFAALPMALAHGYRHLILANERSADEGSFVWSATGEDVNHQWGKSLAAERLLDGYLRCQLLAEVSYFSLLKPIWDVMIFNLLRDAGGAVRATHSCSVRKPWCESCPKCAYVGLGFHAYLDPQVVAGLFQSDLLDRSENLGHYRRLLGLSRAKPFDCVGEIDESRLAMEICRRRGLEGRAVRAWAKRAADFDARAILERYLRVDKAHGNLPSEMAGAILPILRTETSAARQRVTAWLQTPAR